MDFVKILKSFEEFVYEALTWLILMPRTLVRIVLRPNAMTHYAGAQLQVEETRRFNTALSPPLLLIALRRPVHPQPDAGAGRAGQ
jgi:hypothetical protein